jgi:RNA polymerase sigma factor (sigma-70 family)
VTEADRVYDELLPLADSWAARAVRGTNIEQEDMAQVARLGLVKAVNDYDPSKSDRGIRGWCKWLMNCEIREHLRKFGPYERQVLRPGEDASGERRPEVSSLNKIVPGGDMETELIDMLEAPEATTDDREFLRGVISSSGLTPLENNVLFLYYVADELVSVTAERMGCTTQYVDKVKQRALCKVRDKMLSMSELTEDVARPAGPPIPRRQQEVLSLAAEGLSSDETGKHLGIGVESVKTYRKQVIKTLGAKNIVHAIAIGFRKGILT